jgi:hypothetical protein
MALIVGAIVGAVLGAGAAYLLAQSVERDPDEPREPLALGDVLKLVRNSAGLVRQLDDLRHRM